MIDRKKFKSEYNARDHILAKSYERFTSLYLQKIAFILKILWNPNYESKLLHFSYD